jgi:peroxiredoxin
MKHALRSLGLPIAAAVVVSMAILYWQAPPVSKVKIGDTVPDFVLPSHGGGPTRLSSLRGRVVLLFVFKADCDECVAQMSSLENLNRIYFRYGLAVIGLSLDHDRQVVDGFLQRHQVTFFVLDDPDARTLKPLLGGLRPPQAFLLDPSGRVVEIYRGLTDWRAGENREKVRRLLIAAGRTVP